MGRAWASWASAALLGHALLRGLRQSGAGVALAPSPPPRTCRRPPAPSPLAAGPPGGRPPAASPRAASSSPLAGSAAERAYEAWRAQFASAEARGEWMGNDCSRGAIVERFESLSRLVGPEVALDSATKDPIILMWGAESLREGWTALKQLEEDEPTIAAASVVRKNPRILTISGASIKTNSLGFYDAAATVLDALRPLGPLGPIFLRPLCFYVMYVLCNGLLGFLQRAPAS